MLRYVHVCSFNCSAYNHPIQICGLVVYHSAGLNRESVLIIDNFFYNNTFESCKNHLHCVFTLLFLENDRECEKFAKKHKFQSKFCI